MRSDLSPLLPGNVPSVVTIGTFDGVHRGHRHLLARLSDRARAHGVPGVLVTFEPHPLDVVRPHAAPQLLTTPGERLECLTGTDVDYVVVLPFTPQLARLTADQFVDRVLLPRLHMRQLLVGHDHGFGRGRTGDAETLRRIGHSQGFEVEVVDALVGADGQPVSSSRIRAAVAVGDLEAAAAGLGRRYAVGGRVVAGARRGRLLGFPTLNISPPPRKLLPPHGVYAVWVETPHGGYGGMLNLGAKPTFDDPSVSLEAHLFDADVDLYGAAVRVEFIARLRDVRRFDSAAALVAQLSEDERQARSAVLALTQTL